LSATEEELEEEVATLDEEELGVLLTLEEVTTDELLELEEEAGTELELTLEANGFCLFLNTMPAQPFPVLTNT